MSNGKMVIGCVYLFSYNGNSDIYYVNDGRQRMGCLERFWKKLCEEKGKEETERLFEKTDITVTYCVYSNDIDGENEARRDYELLNEGLALETFFRAKIILSRLSEFRLWEENVLNKINHVVAKCEDLANINRNKRERKKPNDHRRDDYALFSRFIKSFDVTDKKGPKLLILPSKRTLDFEGKFKSQLEEIGYTKCEGEVLPKFETFLINKTQIINKLWFDYSQNNNCVGKSLSRYFFRYMLHVAVWADKSKHSVLQYSEWCKDLICVWYELNGDKRWEFKGEDKKLTFGIAKDAFNDTLKLLSKKFPDKMYFENRDVTTIKNMKPGYDVGHLKPFSKEGNGAVEPQLTSINRSIGNRH